MRNEQLTALADNRNKDATQGVWVVYYWDVAPMVSAVYADELQARRHGDPDWHRVLFLPFGEHFDDVARRKR